ncbi:MAG: PTPA-CTERM sorting domain-containing protein [Limnothrix sp.]
MKNQLLFGAIASSAMVFGNLLIAPGSTYALTVTSSTADFCNIANFSGSTQCAGPFSGNDSTAAVNTLPSLFGFTDWTQAGKLDAQSGTQANLISVSAPGAGSNQTWAFNGTFNPAQYVNLAFVVKGSNSFIGYLWDGKTTSGAFKTLGLLNNGGKTPDLSHLSIYTRGIVQTTQTPPPVVPPIVVVPPAPEPEPPAQPPAPEVSSAPPTLEPEPPSAEPPVVPPAPEPPAQPPVTEIPVPPTPESPVAPPAPEPEPPAPEVSVAPTPEPPVDESPVSETPNPEYAIPVPDSVVELPVKPTDVPTPAAVLPVLGGLFGAAKRRSNNKK